MNYLKIIKKKPFSVLLLSNETNKFNSLLNIFRDASTELLKNNDLKDIQFLLLDANSESCHFLIGNEEKKGVWKVRESLFKEEMIKPTCISSSHKIVNEGDEYHPRLWLFHWRDYNLISPLRLTESSPKSFSSSKPAFSSTITSNSNSQHAFLDPHPTRPVESISSQLIISVLSNLIAMDSNHPLLVYFFSLFTYLFSLLSTFFLFFFCSF